MKYGELSEDDDHFYNDILVEIKTAILKAKFKSYKDIKKVEQLKQVLTECLADCSTKVEILKKED